MITISIKILHSDIILPRYHSKLAAGIDLRAAQGRLIQPGRWASISTGLAMVIPPGYEGQIRPRSGMARAFGVTVLNSPGTVDADYRGEIEVLLINHGEHHYQVEPGQRIAQMVIAPVEPVVLAEVRELDTTERGDGGFGSTGSE